MIRLLDTGETDLTRVLWPRVFQSEPVPPDGLIKFIDDVGCVFVFQKVNGQRLYILVNDVWSDCQRQELPAPQGFWDSIMDELIKFVPSGETVRLLLFLTLGGIVLVLLQREGFLKSGGA